MEDYTDLDGNKLKLELRVYNDIYLLYNAENKPYAYIKRDVFDKWFALGYKISRQSFFNFAESAFHYWVKSNFNGSIK